MVSRMLAYGSAWDGTRIAFLSSGVRGGGPRAGRVDRPRERIALDRYRIARRCRDRRRCRPRGGRRWLLSDRGGGGGGGAGVTLVVSGSPFRTAPLACGWRNSTGCRKAVAIARPRRRAGANRSLRAPMSAAESSAE